MRRIKPLVLAAILASSGGLATAAEPGGSIEYVGTVRDLLLVDAERAMMKERRENPDRKIEELQSKIKLLEAQLESIPPAPDASEEALAQAAQEDEPVMAPIPDPPKLISILGSGDALVAEVLVDGERLRFQRGQSRPVDKPESGYRLKSIQVPCVTFTTPQGEGVRVCYSR